MQLRKPATAILALALSAGLAQADDAAPAAGSRCCSDSIVFPY